LCTESASGSYYFTILGIKPIPMELGISAVFCLNWGKKPDLNFALYSDKKM
jgi:hypothetical protein